MHNNYIIDPELKNVRLDKAKDDVLLGNDQEKTRRFFIESGNQFLLKKITKLLAGRDVKLIFFEHSYFATAIGDSQYAVFVCMWHQKQITKTQRNKFQNFFTDLAAFETAYPILWHPDFFIDPSSPDFYLAMDDEVSKEQQEMASPYIYDTEPADDKLFHMQDDHQNGELYIGNFHFPLEFEAEVARIRRETKNKKDPSLLQGNIELLRAAYNTVFDKKESNEEHSYKVVIPILGAPAEDGMNFFGQGSVWLYIITGKDVGKGKLAALAKEIASIFKDISINYIFKAGLDFAKISRKQAIRTAIAQVLARNMSHNLGSHILNKVYERLNNFPDPAHEKMAAYLFEFLRKRMEFIANGVTATFQSNHLLLRDILPAYLTEHYRDDSARNLLAFLFDNISGNESIKSGNIKFISNQVRQDVKVSIPNGTLGFHALYTLLENIIRNSVKHNQTYPEHNSKFSLKYTLKITDAGDFPDYYKVTVTDNFGNINKDKGLNVQQLNNWFDLPLLDNAGNLRPTSWGLLEMKICCAFLVGLPVDLIDQANQNDGNRIEFRGTIQVIPPSIKVALDHNQNLIHTFYLQKPKVAAVSSEVISFTEKTPEIELISNPDQFSLYGSRHEFAIFSEREKAVKHEKDTNQRSVYLTNEVSHSDLDESKLWEHYMRQKCWRTNDIQIISLADQPLQSGKRYILFDNHDYWAKDGGEALMKTDPVNYLFYEQVNGTSVTRAALCEPMAREGRVPRLIGQILETAMTDVMVLDERIQKAFGKTRLNPADLLNPGRYRLYVPPLDGATNLDEAVTGSVIEWANQVLEERQVDQLDYLLIHRSLIGQQRIIIDELESALRPKSIIYISGGGAPPNLHEGDFYLPFDALNHCLSGNPSKYALVSILKSLRKASR